MSGYASSELFRYAQWTDVLPLLGVELPNLALPVRISCPLCSGSRMCILADPLQDGQWHYCLDCRTTGDMLDLAAKVWQLPLPETVRKLLSGNNGPANIDVELAAEENYRKYLGNIQQLIEEGSEYLARSESLYVLADKLDLNQQIQQKKH